MEKFVKRVKGLLTKGKDLNSAVADSTALLVVGVLILWVGCDRYDKYAGKGVIRTNFNDSFVPLCVVWLAFCIVCGIYTTKKTPKENEKNEN